MIALQRHVAEASSDAIRLEFLDVDEMLVSPSSVSLARYKVSDKTSRRELRAWTTFALTANPVMLPLTPVDTAIVNTRRPGEEHVVTLEVTYVGAMGPGQILAEEVVFYVENHSFR